MDDAMDLDGPLDFESEDILLNSPVVNQKRKKVIGLDDLLTDYYKEKSKLIEKESKRTKAKKNYNSDEDEYSKEAKVSRVVDECQTKMKQLGGEEDISAWGMQVFSEQKIPSLDFPEIKSCNLLLTFMNNELNSLVELTEEEGNVFLENLLINGWLQKLVVSAGHVEKLIAVWTFNLMLYSSREDVTRSAFDFWLAILSVENEVEHRSLKIDWFPEYVELRKALENYGYLSTSLQNTKTIDSSCEGPPQNIGTWIKLVSICCQLRSKKPIFSTTEAEELVEVIICLSLDRLLQGLMIDLYESMQSLISYFSDKEWVTSCDKIAKSLASRVPQDLNCLRSVECISRANLRSKHLRSRVAYQILLTCFQNKATDEEEILRLLVSINIKDKSCDLFKVYIYLVLTENWLVPHQMLEEKPIFSEMWGLFLRNCSCQITITDLRSYASKVRSKAAFALQGLFEKKLSDDHGFVITGGID